MHSSRRVALCVAGLCLLCLVPVSGQGPRLSYYFQAGTSLGWAECRLESRAGSTQRVPFPPVVAGGAVRAPLGTDDYTRDIEFAAPLTFVGDGGVDGGPSRYVGRRADWSTGEIDVKGKAVLLAADLPGVGAQQTEPGSSVRSRIEEAARRGAAAVILFSMRDEYSFLTVTYQPGEAMPQIPAITIARSTAAAMLEAAGEDGAGLLAKWAATGQAPTASDLIVRVHLHVDGAFRRSETARFVFLARPKEIDQAVMDRIAAVNERALSLILDLFKAAGPLAWPRLQTVYFAGFDSKVFYTRHWGTGLASDEGVFMVHRGDVPSLGLAAHENAHILASRNWGDTSSFMNEGVGRYAEAAAVDPDLNDREVRTLLRDGKLFPLAELLDHQIGQPGPKTDVGYPAAGSFVGFLIRTYGVAAFTQAWKLEARDAADKARADTWKSAFGKPLADLEREWRASLEGARQPVSSRAIPSRG